MARVLIIGDSHVDAGQLGLALERALRARGDTVTRAGVGATSTKSWLQDPVCGPSKARCVDLPRVVAEHGPFDLALISLGTNDAANAGAAGVDRAAFADQVVGRLAQVAARTGAARAVWVGPPYLRGNVKHYTPENLAYLYAAARSSRVPIVDGRPPTEQLVRAGSGDGVHPGPQAADAWSQSVIARLEHGGAGVAMAMGVGMGVLLVGVLAAWLRRRRG